VTPEGGRTTASRDIFVTGGTGYIGVRLIRELLSRGHVVRALARPGSEGRVPEGASAVLGNALEAESFVHALRPGDTVVHLIGTPHPSPSKAKEFREVDLPSVRAAVEAARRAGASHFVYVSVAQPAPAMRAFVEVRAEGERAIADANLTATVLRPWYVLGPGHRWPLLLVPFYGLASLLPWLRDGAQRLGLVTLRQMVAALVRAVEDPPPAGAVRIVDVPAIRGA
jgi:uncharacterized protein YbjT (DUF2867 family)